MVIRGMVYDIAIPTLLKRLRDIARMGFFAAFHGDVNGAAKRCFSGVQKPGDRHKSLG